jgi:tryptophan synthase alpha chain
MRKSVLITNRHQYGGRVVRAIERTFSDLRARGERAFIPFITAGDPDLEATVRLAPELARAGSDILELGIPFSDPVADGPTIQRSSQRALRHHYGIADYLEAVKEIRNQTEIPLVLFSYFNPILQYGLERIAREARHAGIDGILVTDITPEEGAEYRKCLEEHDLDTIFLIAPTSSPERIKKIAGCSRGFLYLVSRTGVTGAQEKLADSIVPMVKRVREHSRLPIAVGFGISTPDQVRSIWEVADGAVVGSAIVAKMEQQRKPDDLVAHIRDFCSYLTGRPYK